MIARRYGLAFGSGLLFALGLGLSGMTRPSKVIAFLDFTGAWDPSLLLVMGAAVAVTFVAFRWILSRPRPLFERRFDLPREAGVDARLVVGSALFGLGWGVSGLCPGPAIVGVVLATRGALIFAVSMLAGMVLVEGLRRVAPRPRRAGAAPVAAE